MTIEIVAVQDQITERLTSTLAQEVFEGGVPVASTLHRVDGILVPYIVMRYSSPAKSYIGGAVAGARHDSFYSFADVICVAPDDRQARQVAELAMDKLLGFKPVNAGQLNGRPGMGPFVILDTADKPQASICVVSFQYTLNKLDVGA